MSIPVLIQVYDEMRRLAIAGSGVAAGDFRLKKLIGPLEKSGEKAPVFAKVAQAVGAVVNANEKTASTALLELATLVNAILYTQGETGIAGDIKPIDTTPLGGPTTQAGGRVLKPLLEALGSTGSGRIDLVRDAVERGTFNDLRLVRPALRALDDPYPEIADLIAKKVLPLYGRAITAELRATLDIKGRGGHLHRLRLLHRLDPDGTRDLVQQALVDGSTEMKVVAVECLGSSDEDLVCLLEQAKAKARDVRAAALQVLAKAGATTKRILDVLKTAIDGPDFELFAAHVRRSPRSEIRSYVLRQTQRQFDTTLKLNDAKLQGPAVDRLMLLASCLDARSDPESEAFLIEAFEQASVFSTMRSAPSGIDFNELVVYLLARGTTEMRQRVVSAHASLVGAALASAIFAARATLSPAAFFDAFAPVLKGSVGKRSKTGGEPDREAVLRQILKSGDDLPLHRHRVHGMRPSDDGDDDTASPTPLDPRWLDTAVEVRSVELVCELARPNHMAAGLFLLDQLARPKHPPEQAKLLNALVGIRHPAAADLVIDALQRQAKGVTYHHVAYFFGRMIAELPRSAYPKLEALLPTLPDKMASQLTDAVTALKNKPK